MNQEDIDDPVVILGTFGGEEAAGFHEVLDASGIPYIFEGDREMQLMLLLRLAGGNPPDLAILPRPGVMVDLVREGALLPLTDGPDPILSPGSVAANYNKAFLDLGTVDGSLYGLLVKANSKSTIWFKPPSFSQYHLSEPESWNELLVIMDSYIKAGKKPFAIAGLDGWPLTDWFENIYVRVAGPERYRQLFVTNEIKWADPTVITAMDRFRDIVHPADVKLAGGAEGALSTGFIDAFDQFSVRMPCLQPFKNL